MKIIKVKNMNISIKIFTEDKFIGLKRYETLESPKYFIESKDNIDFILDDNKLSSKMKFYELYKYDNYIIQKQINEKGNVIGYIKYSKNYVYLYPLNISFELEYLLSQYALVYFLRLENDSLFMHGSSLRYLNKGIIFTAKSGTGKSTHTRLWMKLSDAVTINDDKNIIALEGNDLVIYSSPWSGKEMRDNNIKSKLDVIVFLYQNKENKVEELNGRGALKLLLHQIETINDTNKDIWNKIVDRMLELPILYYGCNMEDDAFYTIKKELEKYGIK